MNLNKEDGNINMEKILKNKWTVRIGFLILGIIIGTVIINLDSNEAEIKKLDTVLAKTDKELDKVKMDLINEEVEHEFLIDETKDWEKLTEDEKAFALKMVKEELPKVLAKEEAEAEAEALEKEKAEKKAKEKAEKEEKKKAKEKAEKAAKEKAKKEAEEKKAVSEVIEDEYGDQSLKEIIEDEYVGYDDELISYSMVNGEIKVTVELAPTDIAPGTDWAVVKYSGLTDVLLEMDGWTRLTITNPGIGTISMDRSEKETNEFGDYFPTTAIEANLN